MGYFKIDTLYRNKNIFNPDKTLESSGNYGIWDLTKSSITYNAVKVSVDSAFLVTEYYQMRPDLIAAIKLGDHSSVGSLLKMNNISNPFSLMEGNVLLIPTSSTVEESFMAKKNENSAATVRLKPNHMAPKMVAPLRDVPGIKASIWNKPMIKASLYVIFNKLFLGWSFTLRSIQMNQTPKTIKVTTMTMGL